jgi:hypothetical protein
VCKTLRALLEGVQRAHESAGFMGAGRPKNKSGSCGIGVWAETLLSCGWRTVFEVGGWPMVFEVGVSKGTS